MSTSEYISTSECISGQTILRQSGGASSIYLVIYLNLIELNLLSTSECISGQTILRQSGGAASQDPEGRQVTLVQPRCYGDIDENDDYDDYDKYDDQDDYDLARFDENTHISGPTKVFPPSQENKT